MGYMGLLGMYGFVRIRRKSPKENIEALFMILSNNRRHYVMYAKISKITKECFEQ